MANHIAQYKTAIKHQLNDDVQVNLFWKGRVALFAILKAMGVKENDEVILPAFTCVVVPNVIIYLGAKPVYVDIDERTYNMDARKIEKKINSRTKVILAQNTFGLSSELDLIMNIARKENLLVVEDCAHGFGGTYKNQPNGTIAHAAFFSSQWSKPYTTGLGGIAVTKNKELADKINQLEKEAIAPSSSEVLLLKILLQLHHSLLTPATYTILVKLYRKLSKMNLVVGSSQGEELKSAVLPKDFLKKMSSFQAKQGLKALKDFSKNLSHRKKVAEEYDKILTANNLLPAYIPEYATHTFLRYPFQVSDKRKFLTEAEKRNLECGDWFVSPIHPVENNFEPWQYKIGDNPLAEYICRHIINLPTHEKIGNKYLGEIEKLIKDFHSKKV